MIVPQADHCKIQTFVQTHLVKLQEARQVHDRGEGGDGDRLELEARVERIHFVTDALDAEALAEGLVDLFGEFLEHLHHDKRDQNGKRHANREGLPCVARSRVWVRARRGLGKGGLSRGYV